MALRNYSSTAQRTTINGGITNVATSVTVVATTGFPATPFIGILEPDTVNEEVVLVTNVAALVLTITRNYDSTTNVAHLTGVVFQHGFAAIDFREPNSFLNSGGTIGGAVTITGNLTVNGNLTPTNIADTATAASHYFVEVGSDGLIRPKTLANVKTEILADAALTSAYLTAPEEKTNIQASAITASTNFDVLSGQILYYTSASTAGAVTLNIRGSAGTTLATLIPNDGDTLTCTLIFATGATTPPYVSVVQIDATVTGVTTKWQYGTGPTVGSTSATDGYTFTVINTAAGYTVFASYAKAGT